MRLPSRRLAALALNGARAALGAAILSRPDDAARLMVRVDATSPGVRLLTRMAGARDMAIGLATIGALRSGREARGLVLLGGLCDAVDLAAGLRLPGLPRQTRSGVVAAAAPAVVLALYAASGSDRRRAAIASPPS